MKAALLMICLLAWSVTCYAAASIDSILRVLNSFKKLLEVTPPESSLSTGRRNIRFSQESFENLIDAGNLDELDDYLRGCGGFERVKVDEVAALLKAVTGGHLEVFKYLISQGLSVDATATEEQHFLHQEMLTLDSGSVRDEFLLILYENSRALFSKIYEPRLKASLTADEKFIGWQESAIEAMQENDFLYIKWLIEERGARVDCDFGQDGTFIHAAVTKGCDSCLPILLKHGADPNARFPRSVIYNFKREEVDVRGYTPLMLASRIGGLQCTKELLKAPEIEVTKGLHTDPLLTPRAIARKIGDKEVRTEFLKLLRARPADAPRLAKWIDEVDLVELNMDVALRSGKQELLEFLLHNVQYLQFQPKWLEYPKFRPIISLEFSQN